MDLIFLGAPEAAQINVVGNMNNCGFQGMNLAAGDVTSINVGQTAKDSMENSGILNPATDGSLTVGGDINNRSAFTSVTLDLNQAGVQAPDMGLSFPGGGQCHFRSDVDHQFVLQPRHPTADLSEHQRRKRWPVS